MSEAESKRVRQGCQGRASRHFLRAFRQLGGNRRNVPAIQDSPSIGSSGGSRATGIEL